MNTLKRRIKEIIRHLYWIEIKPQLIFKAIKSLGWYRKDLATFSSQSHWKILKKPALFDRDQEGATYGEYFFQDLYVAKQIIESNPKKHIDIGSRVDGFIAHLACVRTVEVLDIRPTKAIVDGVIFHQADIEDVNSKWFNTADCVSCLHTLEHFGLGRYGDKINSEGWKGGLENLCKILRSDGILWLSVPIGIERVEFNSNRVFDPTTIYNSAKKLGLHLDEFSYLLDDGVIVSNNHSQDFKNLANIEYSLGIFKFRKITTNL